jgi:hypothetical protein
MYPDIDISRMYSDISWMYPYTSWMYPDIHGCIWIYPDVSRIYPDVSRCIWIYPDIFISGYIWIYLDVSGIPRLGGIRPKIRCSRGGRLNLIPLCCRTPMGKREKGEVDRGMEGGKSMGVWQGVAMDSLKFLSGLPSPAGRPPLKQLYGHFRDDLLTRQANCGCLLPFWTPYALHLWEREELVSKEGNGRREDQGRMAMVSLKS